MIAVAAAVAVIAIWSRDGRSDEHADALIARIDSLRAAGEHEAALAEARVLRGHLAGIDARPYALGDAERQVSLLERVLAMPPAERARFARADSLRGASDDAYNNDDMATAVELVRAELELRRALLGESHPDVGRTWRDLGYCLSGDGDLEGSVAAFQRALEIDHDALGTHPMVAEDLNMLGLDIGALGRLEEAEAFFRDALRVLAVTVGPDGPDYLYALDNLGDVQRATARFADAEATYRRVAEGYRELYGESPEVASVLNRLAGAIVERGDPDRAVALYRESYEMFEAAYGKDDLFVADVLNNLGLALTDLGHYARARGSFTRAIEIYAGNDDDATRAVAMYNLADVYHEQGVYERSEPLYRAALHKAGDYYEPDDPVMMRITAGLARDLFEQGRYGDAEPIYATVWAAGETAAPADRVRHQYGYAQCLVAIGDLVAAEEVLLEAIPVYEAVRTRTGDGYSRATLQHSPYPLLAAIRLEHGDELEAWEDVERDLGWVSEELLVHAGRGEEAEPYDLADVQRSLGEREAIVGWIDVSLRADAWASWVYVIRESGDVRWERCQVTSDPFTATRRYVGTVSDGAGRPEWETAAHAMWEERFKSITGELDEIYRLVVVPSGAMVGVPVETLIDADGRLLGERYRISYTPSATMAAWLAYREARPLERALVLGAAQSEAATIAAKLDGSELLEGPDASEQRLVALASDGDLARFDVIHVATPGVLNDRRPLESALVLSQAGLPDPVQALLSDERSYDGMLTAGEIVREWSLNAGLVVLSDCDSGSGWRAGTAGYLGLSQALLLAGTRNVVMNRWKVDDRATARLMGSLYRELAGGAAIHDALAVAGYELRTFRDNGSTPYGHPAFWSAFVLLGSGQ